jgi:hypothetical protein
MGRNATDITECCLGSRLTNGRPARGNGSFHNSITRYTDSADITLHISETEELLVVFSIRSDCARHTRASEQSAAESSKGSSSVKRVSWDQTQVESVRIEDSSGQQSSEKTK